MMKRTFLLNRDRGTVVPFYGKDYKPHIHPPYLGIEFDDTDMPDIPDSDLVKDDNGWYWSLPADHPTTTWIFENHDKITEPSEDRWADNDP